MSRDTCFLYSLMPAMNPTLATAADRQLQQDRTVNLCRAQSGDRFQA